MVKKMNRHVRKDYHARKYAYSSNVIIHFKSFAFIIFHKLLQQNKVCICSSSSESAKFQCLKKSRLFQHEMVDAYRRAAQARAQEQAADRLMNFGMLLVFPNR